MFLAQRPSLALGPFVDLLWSFEADLPPGRERVLPIGAMQLLVNLEADEMRWYSGTAFEVVHRLGGAILVGPFDRPVVIDTLEQRRVVGVAFTPMGAAAFLSCPATEVRGLHVPLDDLWGLDGRLLREQLLALPSHAARLSCLDSWLLARGCGRLVLDRAVTFAVDCLGRGARVGAVVDRLGLTPKRFIARFEAQVGLTPKRYARIRRFQHALRLVDGAANWADLAVQAGYCDQSHLVRDFAEFAGTPPSAYHPRSALEVNHVPLAQ